MKYASNKQAKEIVKKDYSKRIIFDSTDFKQKRHLLQTVTIPPKTKQRLHWHFEQTDVFYILEGECLIFINDKKLIARPGDAFICEPKDKHNLWNQSDKPFRLLVFKINLPEGEDSYWEEKILDE